MFQPPAGFPPPAFMAPGTHTELLGKIMKTEKFVLLPIHLQTLECFCSQENYLHYLIRKKCIISLLISDAESIGRWTPAWWPQGGLRGIREWRGSEAVTTVSWGSEQTTMQQIQKYKMQTTVILQWTDNTPALDTGQQERLILCFKTDQYIQCRPVCSGGLGS